MRTLPLQRRIGVRNAPAPTAGKNVGLHAVAGGSLRSSSVKDDTLDDGETSPIGSEKFVAA